MCGARRSFAIFSPPPHISPTPSLTLASLVQALCALALGLYFSAVAMTLLTGSKLWAFCSGYLLFVAGYGIGHNFFHQRDNFWMYAFNLTCFDVFDWKVRRAKREQAFWGNPHSRPS